MSDYKEAATLAKLELALTRARVDPDYLSAKLGATDVRALAAAVDPADEQAVEKLAADVLKLIPPKFVKVPATRAAKQTVEMSAEDAARIRANIAARAKNLDADDHRRVFETAGILIPRRGA